MKQFTLILSLILCGLSIHAIGETPQSPARGIVEVLVTSQTPDPAMPWRHGRPTLRSCYGVVIAPGYIITTEAMIRHSALVEIRQPGQPAKITAKVVQADPRVNAALLSIPAAAAALFTPIPWDGGTTRNTAVSLAQFDDAGQIQTGEGRITETAVAPLPNTPYSLLTFSIRSNVNLDQQGAPVLNGGRLVGLTMGFDSTTLITQAIPAFLLKRFAEDAMTAPYHGFATAGLSWAPLVDPSKRHFFGLPDNDSGVQVLSLVPQSGSSKSLAAGDVILRWDGRDIDSQGYYIDPEFGRLAFSHLIALRNPGDTITCSVLRNHKRLDVQIVLDTYDDSRALIPNNVEGKPAEYLIEGGMYIRELTADYLKAAGEKWLLLMNPRLVSLYLSRAQFPDKPGDRIVFIAGVLPDDINKGYQQIRDAIVTHVNGQPVSSLKDIFAIRKRDGQIVRMTLTNIGTDIVFDPTTLPQANKRISERYRIPKLMLQRP